MSTGLWQDEWGKILKVFLVVIWVHCMEKVRDTDLSQSVSQRDMLWPCNSQQLDQWSNMKVTEHFARLREEKEKEKRLNHPSVQGRNDTFGKGQT